MHSSSSFHWSTVYPKKYAHGFVVLCLVVVMQSFIMNSHEVFIHIHQGCFAGTGAIVRLPQCQWSKPDGYGKISQCITTTKHSKAKTVCIFIGIYCFTSSLQPITGHRYHKWANSQCISDSVQNILMKRLSEDTMKAAKEIPNNIWTSVDVRLPQWRAPALISITKTKNRTDPLSCKPMQWHSAYVKPRLTTKRRSSWVCVVIHLAKCFFFFFLSSFLIYFFYLFIYFCCGGGGEGAGGIFGLRKVWQIIPTNSCLSIFSSLNKILLGYMFSTEFLGIEDSVSLFSFRLDNILRNGGCVMKMNKLIKHTVLRNASACLGLF